MKTLAAAWTWVRLATVLLWRLACETLWPWTRFGAEILGWATVVSLVWFTLKVHQYERGTGRRYAMAPVQVSDVAQRIAAKFSPELQSLAAEHKEDVIAASGNLPTRLAVRTMYPAGLNVIPLATEIGCERALSYLDGLSVAQLVGIMTEHAKVKGHRVHPSVARQAGIR